MTRMQEQWSNEQEDILTQMCDKAKCFRWMHHTARGRYQALHMWFTIPVICLTTISAMIAFLSNSYRDHVSSLSVIVGGINSFAAMIHTVSQFLKLAENMENHKMAAQGWGKFASGIHVTLTLERHRRPTAKDYLDRCRDEQARLEEFSPSFPSAVLSQFKDKISSNVKLTIPDIVGEIMPTHVTRPAYQNSESQTHAIRILDDVKESRPRSFTRV